MKYFQIPILVIPLVIALFIGIEVARADAPLLSLSNVTLALQQKVTINAIGNSPGVYLQSNSNAVAASVQANGKQLTITANQPGVSQVGVCTVGTAGECSNLAITVQFPSIVKLSQTDILLSPGQTTTVTISGGSGAYTISNSNAASVSATLSSTTLSLSAVTVGGTGITICDSANNAACSTLYVNVAANTAGAASTSTAGAATGVNFSNGNPTVVMGTDTTISLTGGGGNGSAYFVLNNSRTDLVRATTNGASLVLTGLGAGSATLLVCARGGDCGTLPVTVASSQTVASATPTPTPAPQATAMTPVTTATVQFPAMLTAGSSQNVLDVIAAMQKQLTVMLEQIKTMNSALVQLATAVRASTVAATRNATISSGYAFTKLLNNGMQGEGVTALQERLAQLGFFTGTASGSFGPATKSALEKYQAARNLEVTGILDKDTRAALNAR